MVGDDRSIIPLDNRDMPVVLSSSRYLTKVMSLVSEGDSLQIETWRDSLGQSASDCIARRKRSSVRLVNASKASDSTSLTDEDKQLTFVIRREFEVEPKTSSLRHCVETKSRYWNCGKDGTMGG